MAMYGEMPMGDWEGKMYCTETDAAKTFYSTHHWCYVR